MLMKTTVACCLGCALLLPLHAGARENTFSIKAGSVRLLDDTKNLGGVIRTFDKRSKATIGILWDTRDERGLGLGFEFFEYTHDYSPSNSGEARSRAALFSFRKYFNSRGNAGSVFHPFVGGMVGVGHTSVSGGAGVSPYLSGAFGGVIGLEWLWQEAGFSVEIKRIEYDVRSATRYDPDGIGAFGSFTLRF